MNIKLTKGLKIEKLLDYGFEKRYDETTGKPKYYIHKRTALKIYVKDRLVKPNAAVNNRDVIGRLFAVPTHYSIDAIYVLYDLIKDGVVEKVEYEEEKEE